MKTQFNTWCTKQLRKHLMSRNALAHVLGLSEANVDKRMLEDSFCNIEKFYIRAHFASLLSKVDIKVRQVTISGEEVPFSVYFKKGVSLLGKRVKGMEKVLDMQKASIYMRIYKESFTNSEKYFIKSHFIKNNIRIK